jgi:hypothetical protein
MAEPTPLPAPGGQPAANELGEAPVAADLHAAGTACPTESASTDERVGRSDRTAARPTDDRPAARSTTSGAVLPDITSDESAAGWGDWREESDDDERFLREVPPHHGTY